MMRVLAANLAPRADRAQGGPFAAVANASANIRALMGRTRAGWQTIDGRALAAQSW